MSGRVSVLLVVIAVSAAILVAGASLLTAPAAKGQEGPKFVGSEKCKMCHAEAHASWTEMKHSKAWESLTPEQIASGKDPKDRPCIQCHVTGYGKPNGWVSEEKTPALKGVGCEACHGAGGDHMKVMVAAAAAEEPVADKKISRDTGCKDCHNPHISYKKLYGAK